MSFVYYPIKDMKHNGVDVYYRIPINRGIHKATVFDDKYTYYYKSRFSNNMRPIGKFKYYTKRSSVTQWNDVDCEMMIEFTGEYINLDELENIYSEIIPEVRDNMLLLENSFYKGYPVYYEGALPPDPQGR